VLSILGAASVWSKLRGVPLSYTSDVPGFTGSFAYGELYSGGIPFETGTAGLCNGQAVSVTITVRGQTVAPYVVVDGGSCVGETLVVPTKPAPQEASVTCNFTMTANQTLTIQ
jgi:hypothetical protein